MTDRTRVLPSPSVMSFVREATRRSPSRLVDDDIPLAIHMLLADLDEAEARHLAQVAAARAGHP